MKNRLWGRRLAGVLVIGFAASLASGQDPEMVKKKTSMAPFLAQKKMTGDWGGVRTELKDLGIDLSLTYQQQYQQNFRGGLETDNGHRLSGTYDFVIKLDFEKFGLLDNSGFYIKSKGGYSDGINGDKVGAKYMKVNGDSYDDTEIYVSKWWFWHKLMDGKIEYRLGVIETNKDLYDISLYANHEDKDFFNKGVIRNPVVPHVTGMGAFVRAKPCDWFYAQAGAFDAQGKKEHTQFDSAFHDEGWYVGLAEFGFTPTWKTALGELPGRYRFGFFYDPETATHYMTGEEENGNVGLYLGFDQMVFQENPEENDGQGLGAFTRYGYAHGDYLRLSDYWSFGLSYKGMIPTRDSDVMAAGFAQAIPSGQYRDYRSPGASAESVVEWYYKIKVCPWLEITPDLQYVVNAGGHTADNDAFVGGVRFRLVF